MPIGIHPAYEPGFANTLSRFADQDSSPGVGDAGAQFMSNMATRYGVQQAFSSFFAYSTLSAETTARVAGENAIDLYGMATQRVSS